MWDDSLKLLRRNSLPAGRARRMRVVLTIVPLLLFELGQSHVLSAQDRFLVTCVKLNVGGQEAKMPQPVVFTPGSGPNQSLCVTICDSKGILEPEGKRCWVYPDKDKDTGQLTGYRVEAFWSGGCVCHGHRCHGGCMPVCWYCRLVIPPDRMREVPGFAYPDFQPPAWWISLWERFEGCAPYKNYVDPEKLKDALWTEYITVFPKTFLATLQQAYGFEGAAIDLVPGMRLRVETAGFFRTPHPGTQREGFVGTGSLFLTIDQSYDENGTPFVSFEPFLGLVANTRSDTPALQEGATPPWGKSFFSSGAIDFHYGSPTVPLGDDGTPKTFRLFYQNQFTAWNSEGPEKVQRIAIVSSRSTRDKPAPPLDAKSLAGVVPNIELARDSDDKNAPKGTADAQDSNNPYAQYFVASFRGRTVVIPEVMIDVTGTKEFYSVGTTAANLLMRRSSWTPSPNGTLSATEGSLLLRSFKGHFYPITFVPDAAKPSWVYAIPLLRGDRIQ